MASRNRGKKKLKLRDLSRLTLTSEQHYALITGMLSHPPPIVTAILGQALLENNLDVLIRARFTRRDDDTWEVLTDNNGPLATFRNKIVAAHAFGICNDVVRDGLHTVRTIRNAFAHSKLPLDFDQELVSKVLQSLTLPKGKKSRLYKNLSIIRNIALDPEKSTQDAYIMLCMALDTELLNIKIKRLQAKNHRLRIKNRQGLLQGLLGYQSAPPENTIMP